MTVDETLASGQYTDRRGRRWRRCTAPMCELGDGWFTWWRPTRDHGMIHPSKDQMRLLIERDIHRDECLGLHACGTHPVPIVMVDEGYFAVQSAGPLDIDDLKRPVQETLSSAMDAARALAVGE